MELFETTIEFGLSLFFKTPSPQDGQIDCGLKK